MPDTTKRLKLVKHDLASQLVAPLLPVLDTATRLVHLNPGDQDLIELHAALEGAFRIIDQRLGAKSDEVYR